MYPDTNNKAVVLVKYWHGGDFGKMKRSSAEQLCQQQLGFYIAEAQLGKDQLKH